VLISGIGDRELKHLEGRTMEDAARELGLDPFDLMVRFIERDMGQTAIVMFQLCEDDLHAACTHRLHMFGSDGLPRPGTKPHPRAYGTFPRVLGLSRDRNWFPLEDAVRRMTSAAAQRFRLSDRGLIRPGLAADLVLFAPDVQDRATFEDPMQMPTGISDLWVNGIRVVTEGRISGALPGRVLSQT
jgi:N-acyl-D-amino-acid deacylase